MSINPSTLPTDDDIERATSTNYLYGYLLRVHQQYHTPNLPIKTSPSKCRSTPLFYGDGASTRAFTFQDKFILRACLVTHMGSEYPMGFHFPEFWSMCSAEMKMHLIAAVDYYITVHDSSSNSLHFIFSRTGIDKLLQFKDFHECGEFKAILRDILQWFDSEGQTLPLGFQKPWIPITATEENFSSIYKLEPTVELSREYTDSTDSIESSCSTNGCNSKHSIDSSSSIEFSLSSVHCGPKKQKF